MNIGLLYEIHQKTFNPQRYEPKDLDVDLLNLESVGYIVYNGNPSEVAITEKGAEDLKAIITEMMEGVDG